MRCVGPIVTGPRRCRTPWYTVVHRRNVDCSTAAESCCICLEGWEIGEEMVTLRCECTHWTHEACLAKSVFETGCCPTCQTSVVDLDDEGNIADVRRLLEKGTQYSLQGGIRERRCIGHQWVVMGVPWRSFFCEEQIIRPRMRKGKH